MELTLKRTRLEVEIGDPKYRILDMINEEQLEAFTVHALNEFGDDEQLAKANELGDVIVGMLVKKKLISENTHQSFVDVMLVSALLHNLFFDSEQYLKGIDPNWEQMFITRRELEHVAQDIYGIPPVVTDPIFSSIEAQLGEDTPVSSCIAKPNTPTELFANAMWTAKEYKTQE